MTNNETSFDTIYKAWKNQVTFSERMMNIITHMFISAIEHGVDFSRFEQEYNECFNEFIKRG